MQFIFKLPLLMSLIFNKSCETASLIKFAKVKEELICNVWYQWVVNRNCYIIRIGTPSWILLAERNMMLAS